MQKPVLEIDGLRKEYKGFTLDDISFSLPSGYIMGLIGPNGAGKTTIIKLILNLIQRDEGKVSVFGLDPRAHEREIKQRIGFVFDERFFFEDLNAGQIAFLMRHFYDRWDRPTFFRYLKKFDIPERKKIKDLSRGVKTKISLAVALSHHAEFLIMDEPTSGLDPIFRREMLDVLTEVIQDEARAVLFSSHITSDLETIADFVTFIDRGRIVFSENKDEVLGRYHVVQGARTDLTPSIRSQLIGFRNGSYGFEGLCSDIGSLRPQLSNQCLSERANLDQIMIFLAREGERNHSEEASHDSRAGA